MTQTNMATSTKLGPKLYYVLKDISPAETTAPLIDTPLSATQVTLLNESWKESDTNEIIFKENVNNKNNMTVEDGPLFSPIMDSADTNTSDVMNSHNSQEAQSY